MDELQQSPEAALPWQSYATPEAALAHRAAGKPSTLAHTLAETFGFAAARKNGKGSKCGFNTTVLSGRLVPDDPASTAVFYRSHLGSLGNLLDAILPRRRPELRELVIQSDLSTTNLVSHPATCARLAITLAGCAAAIRPARRQ